MTICLRTALNTDKIALHDAFLKMRRNKTTCDQYFSWKSAGLCEILLAEDASKTIAGHAIILWQSRFNCHIEDKTPEIMDIFIYPAFRRQGLATRLLTYSETLLKQKGISKLGLGVLLSPEYSHAHILYSKAGYQPISTDHLPDGPLIVYEKKLEF